MTKQPKPYFRKQTQSWYQQLGKTQISLGPDREQAWEKYCELMAGRQVLESTTTFATVATQFLTWCSKHKSAGTHDFYKRHLVNFAKHLGESKKVCELKPYHVTDWIDQHYGRGGNNHRRNAMRSVQRALNWAVEQGKLQYNPLAKLKKPAPVSRDKVLDPDQWEKIEQHLTQSKRRGSPALLEVLKFMRQSGCRPQEARTAEVRYLDKRNRCMVFDRTESKGKIDQRVIPLTDKAFAMCQQNADRWGSGPLFRNCFGRPWIKNSLRKRMFELGQKLGLQAFPYVFRHTFATDALTRSVDPNSIATIMGHKDLTQLMKTYQHLQKKSDHIRAALNQAVGAKPAPTSPA